MTSTVEVADVIERSLFREVNGGELEPIWDIYKPEGVALVIRQALADAGLVVPADYVLVRRTDLDNLDAAINNERHNDAYDRFHDLIDNTRPRYMEEQS